MSREISALALATDAPLPCPACAAALVFFLDYDGTLAPIVDDPEAAYLPLRARQVLLRLAQAHPVAIISGRAKHKIESFVQIPHVYYAGSHGFDISAPPSDTDTAAPSHQPPVVPDYCPVQPTSLLPAVHLTPTATPPAPLPDPAPLPATPARPPAGLTVANQYRPSLVHISQRFIHEVLPRYPGASVEDNKLSVSLHYRKVEPRSIPQLEAQFDDILTAYNHTLRKTTGKCVLEVRPNVNWHKGKAVQHLLGVVQTALPASSDRRSAYEDAHACVDEKFKQDDVGQVKGAPANAQDPTEETPRERPCCGWCKDLVPLYIGDDKTDEDAFRVVEQRGIGILVADDHECQLNPHRQTWAKLRLRDVDHVVDFLSRFAHAGDEGRGGSNHGRSETVAGRDSSQSSGFERERASSRDSFLVTI